MRPLDAIERSLNQVYGDFSPPELRSQDILTTAQIEVDSIERTNPASLEALVRRAWAQISRLHPAVASSFHDDRFVYTVPKSENAIQEWVTRSFVAKDQFFDDFGSTSTSSSASYQDLGVVPPGPQPILYYFRREKVFALRCPHIYTDGTGTLYLLEDFLTELSSLLEGSNGITQAQLMDSEIIQNLPQSTVDAAKIATVSKAEMQSLLPRLDRYLDQEAIQLPRVERSSSVVSGSGRLQSFRLSAEDTANIVRTGKIKGVGFTSLVQAAILHAGRNLSESQPTAVKTHTTVTGFKIRDRCDRQPPNAGQRAFITRASLWPFHVELGDEILDTARNLKAEYATLATNKDAILAASLPFMQGSLPGLAEKMDASFFAAFPGDLTTVIPRDYGRVRLRRLGLCLITTTPMMLVVVQTFEGRMEVRLTYSPVSRKDDEVDRFLQHVKSALVSLRA
ncbi:hypothetical protein F1880_009973 [Penicillium rolfsii]|nr:hypothetical protein F1880_009973 [Penicillium rolfsii]